MYAKKYQAEAIFSEAIWYLEDDTKFLLNEKFSKKHRLCENRAQTLSPSIAPFNRFGGRSFPVNEKANL